MRMGMDRTQASRKLLIGSAIVALAALCSGCHTAPWWRTLTDDLPVMGHRNWIVVADSAYPAQSRAGIETIYAGGNQIEVVAAVLKALDHTRHVRPVIYLDSELQFVPDKDARGTSVYREQLKRVLSNRTVNSIPHEELIAKLDKAGETFRILILKTDMTLPYTSVFLQLDCGYWSAEAEQRLREAIKTAGK